MANTLLEQTKTAGSAKARRPLVEAAHSQAERDLDAAGVAREVAESVIQTGIEEAAQARSAREAWQRERDRLGVEDAAPDPGGNLDGIRTEWHALREELSAAERGMIEAELLNRAQRALTDVLGRRRRFEPSIWERAEILAATTAASSEETLFGAQRRARDAATAAERGLLTAEQRLKTAEADLRGAQPAAGDRQNHLDLANLPEWQPASPDDIPTLLERLEVRNIQLRDRRDAAEQAERDAVELRDAIAGDVNAFDDLVAMWPGDKTPTEHVFAGPKDAARTTMHTLLNAQRAADDAERTTRDDLREAVSATRAMANDPRWRDLETPVAVRIRSLREPDLVAEAAVLGRRVQAVAESASGDLATMDTHRSILRDGLLALCREQRRLLREVSRQSRLPTGLGGELSGQPTVKIRFDEAPDDEAAAHLATRIDSWATELAANPKRASSAETRVRWLADAVRDTVLDRSRAGVWSIEVLKPRIDGKVIYCPPDRIPHEFSGGQVLTLAVLVYCALSGVRAAHRPGGARPAGALILDNPFGAASAEVLIEMQHRLAAHVGLQLICATGLNDANVDNAFTGPGSIIIKLRNDGDLRRNLSYLRLRARVVDGVDIAASITADRPESASQNWVDALRYEIRR